MGLLQIRDLERKQQILQNIQIAVMKPYRYTQKMTRVRRIGTRCMGSKGKMNKNTTIS